MVTKKDFENILELAKNSSKKKVVEGAKKVSLRMGFSDFLKDVSFFNSKTKSKVNLDDIRIADIFVDNVLFIKKLERSYIFTDDTFYSYYPESGNALFVCDYKDIKKVVRDTRFDSRINITLKDESVHNRTVFEGDFCAFVFDEILKSINGEDYLKEDSKPAKKESKEKTVKKEEINIPSKDIPVFYPHNGKGRIKPLKKKLGVTADLIEVSESLATSKGVGIVDFAAAAMQEQGDVFRWGPTRHGCAFVVPDIIGETYKLCDIFKNTEYDFLEPYCRQGGVVTRTAFLFSELDRFVKFYKLVAEQTSGVQIVAAGFEGKQIHLEKYDLELMEGREKLCTIRLTGFDNWEYKSFSYKLHRLMERYVDFSEFGLSDECSQSDKEELFLSMLEKVMNGEKVVFRTGIEKYKAERFTNSFRYWRGDTEIIEE